MRHNQVRDLEASILRDICKDVKVEPELMPVGNLNTGSSNVSEKARLDVSAVGIWSPMERTFLDVRVVHPNAPSESRKSTSRMKKRKSVPTINASSRWRRPVSPP